MSGSGEFEGKVAIVTGAGSLQGIGVATVRLLGQRGARVMLSDVAASGVEHTAATLAGEGLDVAWQAADISDEASVKALIGKTVERFGRLDILDNNAASQGQADDGLIAEMSVELWDRIMSVNARGTMLMCKHAIPAMIAGGGGAIVNISSGTAMAGDFFATAYGATKGAINTLTKYVATQYGAQGIRCNAVVPGLVMTAALAGAMPPPMQDIFRQNSLTERLADPADIAEMVCFLASDRSRSITGQLMPVDNGFYAHTPTTVAVAAMFAGQGG